MMRRAVAFLGIALGVLLVGASYGFPEPPRVLSPNLLQPDEFADACANLTSEAMDGKKDAPDVHQRNLAKCSSDPGYCNTALDFVQKHGFAIKDLACPPRPPAAKLSIEADTACANLLSEALTGMNDPPERHQRNLSACRSSAGDCNATLELARKRGATIKELACPPPPPRSTGPSKLPEIKIDDVCVNLATETITGFPDSPDQHQRNLRLCNTDPPACSATRDYILKKGASPPAGMTCDGSRK